MLTLTTLILPLLLALALVPRMLRPAALALAPWAALPGLALGVTGGPAVNLPWLLLGTRLGLDGISRAFLLFTALIWLAAGPYARAYLKDDPQAPRFFAFFLTTMAGNLGLIVAQDIASFYLFFALMTFAAYGLVVHTGTDEARRAGRVYLTLAIVGEALLLEAFLLSAAAAGSLDLIAVGPATAASPTRDAIVLLALTGFGVKAGALPLHVWLPLAHPVAPTPASAVLSGVIIKAGLLGWIRFLPAGEAALPEWSSLVATLGLAAAFYGVAVGLMQDNPKTVLAYSSISQMGLITVALGSGLAVPGAWPLAVPAVLAYALHHALAKGSLFLGVEVAAASCGPRRVLVGLGLLLPALALAGAPFTSGASTKLLLKAAVYQLPQGAQDWLDALLPWTAVGTTLLMGRFLILVWPREAASSHRLSAGLWLPWTVLLVVSVLVAPFMALRYGRGGSWLSPSPDTLWDGFWPVGVGTLLTWAAWHMQPRLARVLRVPAGDLLVPVEMLTVRLLWAWRAGMTSVAAITAVLSRAWRLDPRALPGLAQGEAGLRRSGVAAFALLVLMLFLLVTLR